MKKSFILLLLPLMVGCGSIPKQTYEHTVSVLDYSEYTKQGFFLTESNSVSFDYEALGSVSVVIKSGYEVLNVSKRDSSNDDIYHSSRSGSDKVKYGTFQYAHADDALKSLCDKAIELRGNGVINIQTTYHPAVYDGNGILVSPSSVVVTGMAIRK